MAAGVSLLIVLGLVMAAITTAGTTPEETLPKAEPPEPVADGEKGPFATARGREQFAEVVQELEDRKQQRAERLATPALVQARERSKTTFLGLGDRPAIDLLEESFGKDLRGAAVPDLDDVTEGRTVKKYLDDRTVVLAPDGDRPAVVVKLPNVARVEGDDGQKRPVDLTIERGDGGFSPIRAATDIAMPDQLDAGLQVGSLGVRPEGAAQGVLSENAEQVVYPNAQVDTDVVVKPVTTGVELFWQLRSAQAPEELVVGLDLPKGATVDPGDGLGPAAVKIDGKTIATVSVPVATDAQGQDVPVRMEARGTELALAVVHRDKDFVYPLLVDPVVEDWYQGGACTWFVQCDSALADIGLWEARFSPNVPWDRYMTSDDCREGLGMGCFMNPNYTYYKTDGLHYYLGPNGTNFPAWSNGARVYSPPGTTTRVDRVDFGIKYLRQNSTGLRPYMYTGVWSIPSGQWAGGMWASGDNVSNHWNMINAGSYPGPQEVQFGFATMGNVTINNWNQGYMGSAIIYLTDPEAPTITEIGSYESGAPPSSWVRQDDVLEIWPRATDPGLGVYHFRLEGHGVGDVYETLPCSGTADDACYPEAYTSDAMHYVDTSAMADGRYGYQLRVIDPIWNTATQNFEVKIDRTRPTVNLSGALWNGRENPAGSGTPVLSAGTHALTINAQDLAPSSAPGAGTSGVKKIVVKVDGDEVSVNPSSCPAGGCSLNHSWTLNTANFGGKRTIRVEATDEAGNVGSRAFVVNLPTRGELISPIDGESTSSRLALQAQATEDGFTGATFEYRELPTGVWKTIGGVGTMLRDDRGNVVSTTSHPVDQPGRKTKKLIWDARTAIDLALLNPKPGPFQVRAVFTGNSGHTSKSVNVQLDPKGLTSGNAQAAIGPGSLDLLTGNFAYSANDAVASGFAQDLPLTRSYNSLDPEAGGSNAPLGPGWVMSAPVDGVSSFGSLVELKGPGVDGWVDVYDASGAPIRFERLPDDSYQAEPGFEDFKLAADGPRYTVTDLDGTVTTFSTLAGSSPVTFVPSKVQQAGEQGVSSFKYELHAGNPQLKRVIAPTAAGLDCTVKLEDLPRGCRVLELDYGTINLLGLGQPRRLKAIRQVAWDPVTSQMKTDPVAEFAYYEHPADPQTVGNFGRLKEVWDPRISPALKERYSYDSTGRISSITPPGEIAWNLNYLSSASNGGKLGSVQRVSGSWDTQTTSVNWGHPLSGSGSVYAMNAAALDAWGQSDRPTDATMIVDVAPGAETLATIHYLNQDGLEVNTAQPNGGISTSEYDAKGNVVRELSATNRAAALAGGGSTATAAGLRSTYRTYSADGLRLLEELGPEHEVKLDSGQVAVAREHTVTTYDEGSTLPAGSAAHLPTTVTTGAKVGAAADVDVRTVKTEYNWTLRKPTRTIVDAVSGGLNVTSQTAYDSAGLEIESRQPKSSGTDAGTTKTVYYTADASSPDASCRNKPEWFNLPCKTMPAAQPGTAGLPDLPVTSYTYDRYGNVLTGVEQVGSASRTKTSTYDTAGRKTSDSVSVAGSGSVPNGLVAAYGFEEGAGPSVADSSGNANAGTISGATWTSSGKYGNALSFDGTNDNVGIPDSNSLDLTNAMTLSAWVKLDTVATRWQDVIFKERGGDGSYGLDADGPSSGKPSISRYKSSGWEFANGTSALATNQWVHLAGTWDGSTAKLYVGGTLVKTQAMTGAIVTSTGMLRIGGTAVFGGNQFVDGLIDEVRIYNRALSQTEVQTDRDTSIASQVSSGLGEPVPTVSYAYNSTTGRPTTVSTPTSTITTGYDAFGRPTSYTDADGTTSTTSYDILNRPVTTNDGKGTQTHAYDSVSGELASVTDSHAGTFTASYDADGRVVTKTYPNGMKADTTYDADGAPVALKYTKTSNCSTNCVWIDEQVKESIHGQWRAHQWELSSQEYTYDKAGRLTKVQDDIESPGVVAGCTIRSYSFDQNANRTTLNTKSPDGSGNCQPGAAGTTKSYTYDDADRLTSAGVQYDKFGRMTAIPTQHSGGGVLNYAYYANDQVRSLAQDGLTKTYSLDPSDRQRQIVSTGSSTATETLHYQDGSDSPAWTRTTDSQGQETAWERSIEGVDGDLAAIRTHNSQGDSTVLQLQNLHGDTVATTSTDPNATALTARFESDEFGNPRQPGSRRFGWLGAKQRRTELASGVIQMGERSYVPALGRFTSVDPVEGGSANAYDYAYQDPVNTYDLDGQCPICLAAAVVGVAAARACVKLCPKAYRALRGVRQLRTAAVLGRRIHRMTAGKKLIPMRTLARARRIEYRIGTAMMALSKTKIGLRLFGRGKRPDSPYYIKGGGLLNRGPIRLGMGWKKRPGEKGRDVFRLSWGKKQHYDFGH